MFGIPTILSTLLIAALPASNDSVLLFLTTPGCVPCRQAAPLVEKLAKQGYPVQMIDASAHPDVVRKLGVNHFPTFLMLSQGKVVDRVVGGGDPVVLEPRILRMFESVVATAPKTSPSSSPAPTFAPVASAPMFETKATASSTFADPDAEINPLSAPFAPISSSLNPGSSQSERSPFPNPWEIAKGTEKTPPTPSAANPVASLGPETASLERDSLIESSVKLRVDDERGHSWGTGTIVDTRNGEALVLTCGHIFRESEGKGKIEVHLFNKNSTVRVYGSCIFYDTEIDLALVVIAPPRPVRAIPIAPASYQVGAGQNVMSVGCDGGANPTVRSHKILSLDRIRTADSCPLSFHYIQISGAPVGGRSGGGLFADDGYLIGVCNSADPAANDGHFVPPHIIRQVLAKKNLAAVFESPSLVDGNPIRRSAPGEATSNPAVASAAPLKSLSIPSNAFQPQPEPVAVRPLSQEEQEQAALEEIKRRAQDGDEVILIVRSKRNPEARPDMIVFNGPSDRIVDALAQHPKQSENGYDPVILSSDQSTISGAVPVSYPVEYR